MNHFVSVYFNYCGYNSRTKLTKEFCSRYPEVCLIEVAYGDDPFVINASNTEQVRLERKAGFITNKLVNDYIQKHWSSIASLTILDSDLELPINFFERLQIHLETRMSEPYFIQPFSRTRELYPDKLLQAIPMRSCAYAGNMSGHPGYIHCYNKKLLSKIGDFPESFLLGGYDFLLFHALFKENDQLSKTIKNKALTDELLDLSIRLDGTKIDYMACEIQHHYHGDKNKRYKHRWDLYQSIDENIIESYFFGRKEDE